MDEGRTDAWRGMVASDLDGVLRLAERCHPGLPEARAVFAERLALFPGGCLVLAVPDGIGGYAVSHPIRAFVPPPLDSLLGALPADAYQFYIHDVVVAPEHRGTGAGDAAIRRLLAIAAAYPSAALVSVYGTAGFWSRFGFRPAEDAGMAGRLRAYGPDAVFMVRANREAAEKKRPSSA